MDFHLPQWITVPNSVTLFTLAIVVTCAVFFAIIKRINFIQRVNKIPGMFGGFTFLGNATTFLVPPEELFSLVMGYVYIMRSCGPVLRIWAGPFPNVLLFTPEAFEAVLSNNTLIDKSREYGFLHPWLNTGLLTSTGSKWFNRRKLLTPTFHFKILGDFVQVFNEQSQILIEKINAAVETQKDGFDIYPFITRCTLDIICESAMGCNIEAQTHSNGEYPQAVHSMCRIFNVRASQPMMQSNLLFHLSSYGAEQRKNLKILHAFTDKVIQSRKLEWKKNSLQKNAIDVGTNQDENFIPAKKRLAFLDLLIDASNDGILLTDTDIREEVDTFMFEGHDTSTAAISWSLLLIGSHPHVQELVCEELDRVFGNSDRHATINDLNELKYLECCIKEALRLYPSVPIMGRQLSQDTIIHGYTVPANTTVLLFTYILHRDSKHFPDPELFQPGRFFEENSRGRHPYVYVPFSAGPRNCIGQKFAIMEEKVILSTILRNFHVKALDQRENIVLLNEVVLRPRDGIRLCLTSKKYKQ